MFLLDDLLLSPLKGTVWIARKIHEAVREAREGERQNLTSELSALYLRLERGDLSEAEFDAREAAILDRLDALDAAEAAGDEGPDDDASSEVDPAPTRDGA